MSEQRELPAKLFSKDELAVLEAAYADLPPVPVVRCRTGHTARAKLKPSNPADFRRVATVLPYDHHGARLRSDGTIEINMPRLEMEFSRQGLSEYFDVKNLKQRLLQRGGQEEGKSIRIALPSAAMSGAFSLGTGAPVPPPVPVPMPVHDPTRYRFFSGSTRWVPDSSPKTPKGQMAVAVMRNNAKIDLPSSAPGVGAGVETPLLWQSMQGAVDWSQVGSSCGFAFLGGFVMAIVDEILCVLITDENRRKLVRRAVNGVASLVGLGFLIAALAAAPVSIPTVLASIVLGFVSSMLGAAVGKLFCECIRRLYHRVFPDPPPGPVHWVPPPHQCGTAGEWFQVGKCLACEVNVASCMLVHQDDNAAHMVFCAPCLEKYTQGRSHVCVCGALMSSVATLECQVCPEQCCLEVGHCRKADCLTTATCWKEDTRGATPDVSLEYCEPHMQKRRKKNQNPQIRYGNCFLLTPP